MGTKKNPYASFIDIDGTPDSKRGDMTPGLTADWSQLCEIDIQLSLHPEVMLQTFQLCLIFICVL